MPISARSLGIFSTSTVAVILTGIAIAQVGGPTSVELKGANGVTQTYQLKSHPRVWLDGADGPITRSLMDPDGLGPRRSPKATGPAWDFLQKRLDRLYPRAATALSGNFVMLAALAWFMDQNGKLSNGTSYRDAALDQLRHVEEVWVGLGGCDKAVTFCGTTAAAPSTHTSYMGSFLSYWAVAYSLMRNELTPAERRSFAEKILNGITWDIGGDCDNRFERTPGAFRISNGTSVFPAVGDGTRWDRSMEGHWYYVKKADSPGSAGIFIQPKQVSGNVQMTIEKPSASSFYNRDLHLYRIKPWASGQCGMGYVANHHGNNPAYAVRAGSTRLTAAISEADAEVMVADASFFPTHLPFFVYVGPQSAGELLRVTKVNGTILTVTRGEFSTQPKSWPVRTTLTYSSHMGTGDPMGWNNRTLTRQVGHILVALALADDDPRAVQLLKKTTDFWYSNTWFAANNYFTMANTCLTSYGLSRLMPFLLWSVQALYAGTVPALDYRGEWIKRTGADFFLHWTTPWDQNLLINWGIAADNCMKLGGGAELQCIAPAVWLQGLYPGSNAAEFAWFWLKDRRLLEDPRFLSDGMEKVLLPLLLFTDPGTGARNYREALLSHIVSTATDDDQSDPATNFSVVSSKTDWTPNATHLYVLAPDDRVKEFPSFTLSEKVIDSYNGDYGIGKQGWFLGQTTDGVWMRYTGSHNVVDFGPVARTAFRPHTDLEIDWRKDNHRDVLAFRIDLKNGYSPTHRVNWAYRYFMHFKAPGKSEQIIVYDDVGTERSQRIRSMLHYPNNGEKGEGNTRLDMNNLITTNHGKGWMYTRIAKVDGSRIVTDLNASWKANTATVGTYCSEANPCLVRIGDRVFEYKAPSTVTAVPSSTELSAVFIWLNPNDGKLYAARNNAEMQCDGLLQCSPDPATDFPSDVIRVAKMSWNRGRVSGGCPGQTTSTQGSEYNLCVGGTERHVFLDAGPNAQNAEFMVVHEPRLNPGTPAPVTDVAASEGFTAIEIGGANPKVAVFPRQGLNFTRVLVKTTHTGVGQYAVAGLSQGVYDVLKNGSAVVSGLNVLESEHIAVFESESGEISLVRTNAAGPVAIVNQTIDPATVSTPFALTLKAIGGTPPYTWGLFSGDLPPGITLSSSGVLSGTPTTPGTSDVTFRVTDMENQTAVQNVSWVVKPEDTSLRIITTTLPSGAPGEEYNATISAAGGVTPYEWSIQDGDLPPGLSLDPETGEISGEPAEEGEFTFSVLLQDSAGVSVNYIFTIEIAVPS